MARKLLIGVVILMFSMSAIAGEKITIATLDWAPYIGKNLKQQGFVAQVVRAAFKAEGYNDVKLDFMTWNRVVKMAKMGRYDAYGPEYYDSKLKRLYYVSKPFPGDPLGFFKLKSKNIKFKKLQDLKGYKIGVVRGYVNTVAFDKASYLTKEAAKDDLTNIKKLLKGRIDLYIGDRFVGLDLIKKYNRSMLSKVEFIRPALEKKSLYLCFRKSVKGAKKKADAFNRGLAKIKRNGTLRRIMRKNGF